MGEASGDTAGLDEARRTSTVIADDQHIGPTLFNFASGLLHDRATANHQFRCRIYGKAPPRTGKWVMGGAQFTDGLGQSRAPTGGHARDTNLILIGGLDSDSP